MKPLVLNFYIDPGHGWLEVTSGDLAEAGLSPGDFSRYSYRVPNSGVFYLEEDCDAPRFIDALRKRKGRGVSIVEILQDPTFVRALPRIS